MKVLALFLACLALCSARQVRREADTSSNVLQDIEKHAESFQKTFKEQLSSLANSKNTQEFQKSLEEGTNSVLQQLSALSTSFQSALSDANGKAKEALQSTSDNLKKTVEDLRKSHPEIEQQATALRDKLQVAVQNAAQETQKLAKEVAANVEQTNNKLAPQLKQAYDEFVKHAEEVQKKLHEVATKQ